MEKKVLKSVKNKSFIVKFVTIMRHKNHISTNTFKPKA